MAHSAREIVQEELPPRMAKEIWSSQYDKVLPVSFDAFELSAILPAVFYMFRFGQRRGSGNFLKTFAPDGLDRRQRRLSATVERVAEKLAAREDILNFDDEVERAILGDLLLGYCVENKQRSLGRDKQIQRVAPTHFMASWIDLPYSVAYLRFVPEMIVAMLAGQKGEFVNPNKSGDRAWFPVAANHDENLLLRAFSKGVSREGLAANLSGDKFDEQADIGIDQLLIVRIAQSLGSAPEKVRGKRGDRVSNQRPIAERAAHNFSEDIRRFVRSYASVMPRHCFVATLEACIATGMTAIFSSTVDILCDWAENGRIKGRSEQRPANVFVDCSVGIERDLRSLAEYSFDDLMRRIERLPTILMMLRILDYAAKDNRRINQQDYPSRPFATAWLDLLGALLHERDGEATFIHHQMEDHGARLADALSDGYPEAAAILLNEKGEPNPIRRLAAALTPLLGNAARRSIIVTFDSALNVGRPNGLTRKRRTKSGAQAAGGGRKSREVRSLVLTDAVLDYLVHLHLLPRGRATSLNTLSLQEFLKIIRERYGFHVDVAPPEFDISNDDLRANRIVLERRLRNLGLLVGVNDAEAMKRLRPRFEPKLDN